MAEPTARLSAPRSLPAAASLFSMNALGVDWQDKVKSVDKDVVVGKSTINWVHEEEDNNQDDDGPQQVDSEGLQQDLSVSPARHEVHLGHDELRRLRDENTTLAQRLAVMETQHAQHIGDLETKLQHAIETHREIEQRLRTQLQAVLREQQEAVENARKVRGVLARVSTWVRQVQRATHTQRPPFRTSTAVHHDLELRVSPHTNAPYTLWTGGTNFATNVHGSQTSPIATGNTFEVQDPIPESFEIQVNSISEAMESLPPPAPGRNRAKSVPGKGFNYVEYTAPSPPSQPAEIGLKPLGGHCIVLDGLPSVGSAPRRDTPAPKRSAGNLFAFCAQVVTTSLAGVRSSPSPPHTKVTPVWKLDHLCSVREENEVDEEAGQCSPQATCRGQRVNVALPNLSLGLL